MQGRRGASRCRSGRRQGALGTPPSCRAAIAATFPLDRIAEAHRQAEGGHTQGKIVVTL
ncbi:zinc-binding dehydrogenase [Actinoplanes sp. M2I2]|uniref:zinc-binding dehydrogenase n=1 Tax=Actinoplanes sp. M2I2 TaxID=1734444 RepID=UPI0024C47040|nr:zinc-binding dehydrogenase [Actinoplanes sp. M2I2]